MILKKFIKNNSIYLISDVHANLDLFKECIKDLDLNKEYLFILGDLIEKGDQNIDILDYVIDIMKSGHVFYILGNCDNVLREFKRPCNKERLNKYSRVLKKTILNEFYEGIGANYLIDPFDIDLALDLINIKYKKYFDFVLNLPTSIVINDKVLLTHCDFSEAIKKNLVDNDEIDKVKNYPFKVCGHLPIPLFFDNCDKVSLSPLVKDGFLYIDGGNNVTPFGGLNLVKLNISDLSYSFNTFYSYKQIKVINNQEESKGLYKAIKTKIDSYTLSNNLVKVNVLDNLYYGDIKGLSRDHKYIWDITNIFLKLEKEDFVYLVSRGEDVSLIIKDNMLGLAYNLNLDLK